MPGSPAVFLDRDGVLVEDVCFLTRAEDFRILPGVPAALTRLHAAGFQLIMISNQSVVARGMISEGQLEEIHAVLQNLFVAAGAPPLDAIYCCPHHPEATLPQYRMACECRKPRPGAILHAAGDRGLDLAASYLVGDRITDVVAGVLAGCRTVLVRSPATADPPIVTVEPLDESLRPDYVCADLGAAADWILRK